MEPQYRAIRRTITLNIEVNNHGGENELRQTILCDDEQHVEQRVEEAIAWFGEKQGYCVRWTASEYYTKIMGGEWGYEGDDWAEPPTVGNEVI